MFAPVLVAVFLHLARTMYGDTTAVVGGVSPIGV